MNFIDGKALLLMSKTTPDCQFAYIYPVTKSPPPNPLLVQTVAEGVAESMAAPPTTCGELPTPMLRHPPSPLIF